MLHHSGQTHGLFADKFDPQAKTGLKGVRLLAADELEMIDASWLSPWRFTGGRLIHETAVL